MSTALSAFAAVKDKYLTLTDVPKLYTFDAPVSDVGAQVRPPYAVLLDGGTTPGYEFEHKANEVTELTLMVYADTLNEVDAYANRIKYNGGAIGDNLGLDFGDLPTLSGDFQLMEVRRVFEHRFAAMTTGVNAQRIHGIELRYRVALYRVN